MGQQHAKVESSPLAGLRVVRGPNWKWQDQDGGEGHVGTIVGVRRSTSGSEYAIVHWDRGVEADYRCSGGDYDLRVFDNAPSGVRHERVQCRECNATDIAGTRWKCMVCSNVDLCTRCYMSDRHNTSHRFTRRSAPGGGEVALQPRNDSRETKIKVKGIITGAKVVRGRDWDWDEQDGGKGGEGTVRGWTSYGSRGSRDAVCVRWDKTSSEHLYRLGYDGKVDLKYTTDAVDSEEYYYRDHLALVGEEESVPFKVGDVVKVKGMPNDNDSSDMTPNPLGSSADDDVQQSKGMTGVVREIPFSNKVEVEFYGQKERRSHHPSDLEKVATFKAGITVKITDNEQEIKDCLNMPSSAASKMLGKEGTVSEVYEDGDLGVKVGDNFFIVNPLLCKVIDSSGSAKVRESEVDQPKIGFKNRDIVTIISDEQMAKSLQKGHGGWNDDMKESLGQTGEVLTVHSSGNIRVKVNKRKWTYNPKCLMLASPEAIDQYMQRSSSSSSGSNSSSDGVSALSDGGSGARGRVQVRVKVKTEAQMRLMVTDSMEGLSFSMPTRHAKRAAFNVGDFVTIGDVGKGETDGSEFKKIAGVTARVRTIEYDAMRPTKVHVIANNKLWILPVDCIQMCHNMSFVFSRYEKDRLPRTHQLDSDAMLVRAVQSQLRSLEDVEKVLAKHQTKLNTRIRGFAPLHIAAIVGRSDIVERLLDKSADVDLPDGRCGCTALHHAAFLGHSSTVRVLLDHKAKVVALCEEKWTALHYAAAGLTDSVEIVKLLLKPGVEIKEDLLNVLDKYGRPPLHLAIKRHNYSVIDEFINRGADLMLKNREGLNALHVAVLSQSALAVEKILSKLIKSDRSHVDALSSRGMTALHLAVGLGYENLVELLLREGKADVNCREKQTTHPHEDTPLLLAVRRGYDNVAELLVKYGADVEAKDSKGHSRERIAADRLKFYGSSTAAGAKGLRRQICSKKVEVDREQVFVKDKVCKVRLIHDVAALRELQQEYGGWSPLMENIAGKTGDVTWKFSDVGARPGGLRVHVDGMNWTINPICCEKIDLDSKDECSDADESRIGRSGSSGGGSGSSSSSSSNSCRVKSPVIRLSDASDEENLSRLVVKSNTSHLKSRLEKLKLSPEKINERTGDVCALHVAAGRGKVEAIKLLVAANADVNVEDVDNDTPLHHAIVRGEADAAKLLIESNADFNRKNKRMHTPMHYACGASSENLKCLQVLLSKEDCDVNAQDQDGDTPLHCAIGKGHKNIIEELVKDARINLDARNHLGFNPLHHAAFRGDESTVKCILSKHRHLVDECNDRGQTALHLAVIHGRQDVARILLDEGKANVDVTTDKEPRTPLLCAVAHGRRDAVKLLLDKGATLSAQDKSGKTCLHLELKRQRLLYGPAEKASVADARKKPQLEIWLLLIENEDKIKPIFEKDGKIAKDACNMGFPLICEKSGITQQQVSTGSEKPPSDRAKDIPAVEAAGAVLPRATTACSGDKSTDDTAAKGSEPQEQEDLSPTRDVAAHADSVAKAEQDSRLKVGDWVQIVDDKQKVKRIQRSHGGWYDGMADALGRWCKVVEVDIDSDRDIRVLVNNRKWRFGRQCILPGTATCEGDAGPRPNFKRGAAVKICSDKDKVKSLQKQRWTEPMAKVLGTVGRVTSVCDDGDVRVRAAGHHLKFNPLCLSKADDKEASDAMQQWPLFEIGDVVKVIDDIAKAKELQKGHGGWCDPMKDAIGKVGTVVDIDNDDDVRVSVGGRRWVFNPQCLASGSASDEERLKAELGDVLFKPGERVKILDNGEEVRRLQRGHGGWNREMSKAVGKIGKVIEIDSDNDVKVRVAGRSWSLNPQCLSRAAADAVTDASDGSEPDGSDKPSSSSSSSTSRSSEDGFRAFLKSLRKRLDKEGKDDEAKKKRTTSGAADSSDRGKFSEGDFVTVVSNPYSESGPREDAPESVKLVGKTVKVCRVLDDDGGHLEVRDASSDKLIKLQSACCRRATEAERHQAALQIDGVAGAQSSKPTTADDSSSSDSSDDLHSSMKRADSSGDRGGREALMSAVTQGNLSNVKKALLKAKEQVNDLGSGMAPLHVAAGKGAIQIMLLLIDAGADVALKDKDGDTPLHHATLGGEHDAAELLLERGAPPDAVNERSLTPLHLAVLARKGGEEKALGSGSSGCTSPLPKLLLEKCDVNAKDEDGDTALHVAVNRDIRDVVDQLLQLDKIDVTLKNDLGLSVLHLAVRQRNEGALKLIIKRILEKKGKEYLDSAVINSTSGNGRTALHMAAQLNFLAGAELLLKEVKTSVNVEDNSKARQTPLHLALANGHLDLVKCLVDAGATRLTLEESLRLATKAQQLYGDAPRTKALVEYVTQLKHSSD